MFYKGYNCMFFFNDVTIIKIYHWHSIMIYNVPFIVEDKNNYFNFNKQNYNYSDQT